MRMYLQQLVVGCGKEDCGNPFCKCRGKQRWECPPPFQYIQFTAIPSSQEEIQKFVLKLTKESVTSSQFWLCTTDKNE